MSLKECSTLSHSFRIYILLACPGTSFPCSFPNSFLSKVMQFAFLITLCTICASQAAATCYNPDGSKVTDPAFQPCNQVSGAFSQCCGTNHTGGIQPDICQSDGLCQNAGDAVYWRESCTDPTWKSPFCLSQLCTNKADGGDPSNNVPVGQCSDGSWCCGGVNVTCCNLKLGVTLLATIGVSSTTFASGSTSTPTSASTSTPVSTCSSSSSSTSTTSSPTSAPSSDLSSGAKIGIGVGIAGVVLAISVIMLACVLLKKQRARKGGLTGGTYEFYQTETAYHEAPEAKLKPVEAPLSIQRTELPS